MHQENRFVEQITVIELLDTLIKEHIDNTADKIQIIENTLYAHQHTKLLTLKQYLEHK